jgi:hypothetical protein
MPKTKVLARNWIIEVGIPPVAPATEPTWTKVGGVNTFTISHDKEDADTTDFDDQGYNSHIVASRSNEITFEGFYIEDELGARDAGQQLVEDHAEEIGPESIKPLRLTSPGGKVRQWDGSFVTGDVGGGNNDATSWGSTFTPSGPPVTVTP